MHVQVDEDRQSIAPQATSCCAKRTWCIAFQRTVSVVGELVSLGLRLIIVYGMYKQIYKSKPRVENPAGGSRYS